jgi:hypothetical protein
MHSIRLATAVSPEQEHDFHMKRTDGMKSSLQFDPLPPTKPLFRRV